MRREFLREILKYHPDKSEAVLAEFGEGDTVRRLSNAEVFGAAVGYRANARQHVTMSESELGQFTRQ
jgi:hypothetical protein